MARYKLFLLLGSNLGLLYASYEFLKIGFKLRAIPNDAEDCNV